MVLISNSQGNFISMEENEIQRRFFSQNWLFYFAVVQKTIMEFQYAEIKDGSNKWKTFCGIS